MNPLPRKIRYKDVVLRMRRYIPDFDDTQLRKAYKYAKSKHRGQKRLSGEAYLMHPLHVACILADMEIEPTCIVVALLHDVVEDTSADLDDIETHFGSTVASLVNGVTKLEGIAFTSKRVKQAENFRKFIVAMAGDIRVLLVKLADRLHNMRTAGAMPEELRRRKALETMEVYAPLAHRLGIGKLKTELEDLAFQSLEPEAYASLSMQIEAKRKLDQDFVDRILRTLHSVLEKHKIQARIEGRVKSVHSIYQKLVQQHIALEQVYDYLAFRIIAPLKEQAGKDECYRIMGVLHSAWTPVPGRFKDFIAISKPNGYQSLHTTLMTAEGQPFEVQIRTEIMHRMAEEGVAAHWKYKEGSPERASVESDEDMYRWLRRTVAWLKEVKDPGEFLDSIKGDLLPSQVYVFSPKGDIFAFARGATPLDFAYRVHSEIGHRCIGAKINGRIAPLETRLRNGDIVEIRTSKESRPKKDWLRMVHAARSKSKIRAWFNREEKARGMELGRETLVKYFRRHGTDFSKLVSDVEKTRKVFRLLSVQDLEKLMANVGNGILLPRTVFEAFCPEPSPAGESKAPLPAPKEMAERLVVRAGEDILIHMAQCCHPIPGEDVIGYVTRGSGVSVHRRTCKNVMHLLLNSERKMEVVWEKSLSEKQRASRYAAKVIFLVEDRSGMLANVSACIAERNCNIKGIRSRGLPMNRSAIRAVLEVTDMEQLDRTLQALKALDGVLEVRRT